MNLNGKANLFVKLKTVKDNTIYNTNISIAVNTAKKDMDPVWKNINYECKLCGDLKGKEKNLKEDVCYKINIEEAFITARTYQDKEGNEITIPVIAITKAKVESSTEVKAKPATKKTTSKPATKKKEAEPVNDDDLPF